jgi:alpha-beta hydrolase superfamily lysophospholipase
MRAPRNTLMAASLVALVACADAVPSGLDPSAAPLLDMTSATEPASGPWARIVEGQTGSGSLYAIYVPRSPNGDAVFYAHGFRDVGTAIDLRDQDSVHVVRDMLGALGYTVAYSSFSENGFAVKDGAQRTHQLRGLVAAELNGQPARSFLVGHSLGGAIGLDLAERYPRQYDGALLMCGMVGGSRVQTQYLGHVRALFDFFYPGKLTGGVLTAPETPVTLDQVVAAVQSNPTALYAIASTEQTPLPFVPSGAVTNPASPAFQTLVGSLFGALSFHSRGIENILDLTNGQTPFDNNTTTYTLATPLVPAQLLQPMLDAANAVGGVGRFASQPKAENYLENHFTPTGDLRIPVVTLHNMWDPGVPNFHEAVLKRAVDGAGASGKLLQRPVPSFGHCNIRSSMAVQAFKDLAHWVSTGIKPPN